MSNRSEPGIEEVAESLERWRERTANLRLLSKPAEESSQREYARTLHLMEDLLQRIQQMLSRADAMTPEEWVDARTQMLAALQTLQVHYNNAVADWPQR